MLEIASWINAEEAGAIFGRYAILVFSLVLAGLFAASIGLWCLLDQLENRVRHFPPADSRHVKDSTSLFAFRNHFLRSLTHVAYRLSPGGHLGLYSIIALFILAVTGASFLVLALEIAQQDWLVRFDNALAASLHEHSTVTAVRISQLVSFFGDASILASISLIFAIALVVTRYWRLFFLWTITLPGAGILNQFLKNTLQRQRPQLPIPGSPNRAGAFPVVTRSVPW